MKTSLYLSELCKISETLSTSPQPEELLSQILSASLRASGADEGSLMLLDEETNSLRVKVGLGLPQEVYKKTIIKLGEPIAGIVAQVGQPLLLDNQTDVPVELHSDSGRRRGIKSSLCLPLKVMDKTIGVLNLNFVKQDKTFSKRDQELLSVFATVAAISLEHAGLYSTTKQHIEEMVLLNKLGESLGASFSFEGIFNLTVKAIEGVMDMDIFSLVFLDEERVRVRMLSRYQLSEEAKKGIGSDLLKVFSDLTGDELTKGEPELWLEIKEPQLPQPNIAIQSEFSLPLVAKAKIIGMIRVSSFSRNRFSENYIRFLATLAPQVAISLENAKIYKGMQELYTGIINALSAELETRNPYTMGHSERVTRYAVKIGQAMGLSSEELEMINYAALFHDLGKIGVADSILLKPGPLLEDEWEEIKKHAVKSEGIVKFVSFLKGALPIIRHHHERFDGNGYPNGFSGHQIPLGARIIAVADTFDAVTSKRPYREKMAIEEAIRIIKNCSGTQFDPEVVSAFFKVIEEEEALIHW